MTYPYQQTSDVISVKYQYMANKKNYFLGIRPGYLLWVVLGLLLSIGAVGSWWTLCIVVCWITIGKFIDNRQSTHSRDYVQMEIAWIKTKNSTITDTKEGILSIFKNGKY